MKLFSKEEVNTGRQIELDLTKVHSILGMVFVHCFEELPISQAAATSLAYFILGIVLNACFGAGTFMGCMGIGISYSTKNTPDKLMKRGIHLLMLAFVLNLLRYCIPNLYGLFTGEVDFEDMLIFFFDLDILQFAGLAFILFGFLKQIKLPDWVILCIALAMSCCGSFLRLVEIEEFLLVGPLGLFISTTTFYDGELSLFGCFPLLNWFIIVVFGYLYGKMLRRVTDKNRYYAIALPASTVILAIYMPIAITQRIGMLSGDINYYYALTTPETLILVVGMVFISSLYYFISKLLGDKAKAFITRISAEINDIYCIHWIIIGILEVVLQHVLKEGLAAGTVFAIGGIIFVVSILLADWLRKAKEKARVNRA